MYPHKFPIEEIKKQVVDEFCNECLGTSVFSPKVFTNLICQELEIRDIMFQLFKELERLEF